MSADQTSSYRPKPITQRDGTALANSNCRMASIATGLDYHTRGDETSTGGKMRSYTSDQSGGTDGGDAKEAWVKGYKEVLTIRDGNAFDTLLADLRAGRLVHIDVWHAATGPCLSGTGQYGHTMVVLPDCEANSWLVADPWCKPARWVRVPESKLREGAELWGRRVYGAARREPDFPTGGYDPREPLVLLIVARIVKRFMDASFPTHEAELPDDDGDTSGPQPVLYTVTKAREPGGDMATIILNSGVVETKGIVPVAGRGIYDQPDGKVIRNTKADETLLHLGYVDGGVGWEVIDLGNKVAYLKTDAIKSRVDIPLPCPPGECSDEEILEAQQEGYDLAMSVFPPRPE